MNRLARFLSRRSTRPGCATRRFSAASTASTTARPLRILFCGSDAFSIACLEPLARILRHDSHNVQSIDVLCRTDKMVGRGLKTLSEGARVRLGSLGAYIFSAYKERRKEPQPPCTPD